MRARCVAGPLSGVTCARRGLLEIYYHSNLADWQYVFYLLVCKNCLKNNTNAADWGSERIVKIQARPACSRYRLAQPLGFFSRFVISGRFGPDVVFLSLDCISRSLRLIDQHERGEQRGAVCCRPGVPVAEFSASPCLFTAFCAFDRMCQNDQWPRRLRVVPSTS